MKITPHCLSGQTVSVVRRQWWLMNICVVQKNNRDFLNPIQFQLTQRLQDADQPVLMPGRRLPDIDSFPVLNATLAKNILSVRARLFNPYHFFVFNNILCYYFLFVWLLC